MLTMDQVILATHSKLIPCLIVLATLIILITERYLETLRQSLEAIIKKEE